MQRAIGYHPKIGVFLGMFAQSGDPQPLPHPVICAT